MQVVILRKERPREVIRSAKRVVIEQEGVRVCTAKRDDFAYRMGESYHIEIKTGRNGEKILHASNIKE